MENPQVAGMFDEIGDLEPMRWGVDVARRGWVGCSIVINTRTERQLRNALGRR